MKCFEYFRFGRSQLDAASAIAREEFDRRPGFGRFPLDRGRIVNSYTVVDFDLGEARIS